MKELPDGPNTATEDLFPIFMSNPFPFLKQCQASYGDMFTLALGDFGITEFQTSGKWVFLANADYLKVLFKAGNTVQLAGRANQIQFQKLLPEEGSVMLDGPAHLERRRMLSKLLQGGDKIRSFTDAMCNIVIDEIKQFPADREFELSANFRHISSVVMRHLTFGDANDDDIAKITYNVSQFGDPTIPPDQKKGLVTECLHAADQIIRKCPHASAASDDSAFSVLMNSWQNEKKLEKADLEAELLVIMLGGVDTTASTMAWIMAQLYSHPEAMDKVMAELESVFGDGALTADKFDQLTYLDAVIHETCRLSPLLMNSSARLLIQPLEIDGHLLPAGTMVVSCMHLIHMREEYYPEPGAFKPERFVGTNPDPFRHVYFGGGIRRCLGMAFALYEMKVVIATLLLKSRLEPVTITTEPELQGSFFAPRGSLGVKLGA